jgi:hypothetical protein
MAAVVLLVSENKLKAFTALHENVRVEDVAPFVLQAQDLFLQPQLGTKFYKELKDGVLNNTLTPDETELLEDYIAPMLIHRAFALSVPFIKYKVVDKGVVSGTSETSTQTSLDEVQYLISKIEDTAEFYAQRLREFFFDHPGMFPAYINPGIYGMLPDRTSPYFSGLVIPNRRGYGSLKYTYQSWDGVTPFCFWSGPAGNGEIA